MPTVRITLHTDNARTILHIIVIETSSYIYLFQSSPGSHSHDCHLSRYQHNFPATDILRRQLKIDKMLDDWQIGDYLFDVTENQSQNIESFFNRVYQASPDDRIPDASGQTRLAGDAVYNFSEKCDPSTLGARLLGNKSNKIQNLINISAGQHTACQFLASAMEHIILNIKRNVFVSIPNKPGLGGSGFKHERAVEIPRHIWPAVVLYGLGNVLDQGSIAAFSSILQKQTRQTRHNGPPESCKRLYLDMKQMVLIIRSMQPQTSTENESFVSSMLPTCSCNIM
jgi:hypothetical protein